MSAISALKKLDQKGQPDSGNGGLVGLLLHVQQSKVVKQVRDAYSWSTKQFWKWYQYGGRVTWIVATTLLFTVIPLGMEIMREADVKEVEALRVQALKAQGYTSGQIAQMGYVDASNASLTEALQ
ncbi:Aste57867_8926 [Aphanomyces stellatus]|uniref:Aste57867_8926 protein n=1 Tax=Aphanomyces stellatus TaxID=120398 RepID=A0A485KLH5_9STRA|nr:hypothetical protein As57867_008891 [Aphanomyces stellatus]VFT85810.1 Aste57867_8926 [Aphanomyces stellatus]